MSKLPEGFELISEDEKTGVRHVEGPNGDLYINAAGDSVVNPHHRVKTVQEEKAKEEKKLARAKAELEKAEAAKTETKAAPATVSEAKAKTETK